METLGIEAIPVLIELAAGFALHHGLEAARLRLRLLREFEEPLAQRLRTRLTNAYATGGRFRCAAAQMRGDRAAITDHTAPGAIEEGAAVRDPAAP
jgi:hypothetical protein